MSHVVVVSAGADAALPGSGKADIAGLASRAEQAGKLLGAMANPKRLVILCELLAGECSVSELTERMGARQSTISQHLSLLKKDGFVASRRSGQTQYYSLVGHEVIAVLAVLHSLYCARQNSVERDGTTTRGTRRKVQG